MIQVDCQVECNPVTAQTKVHTDLNSRSCLSGHGTSRLFTAPGAPCASTSPGASIAYGRRNGKKMKVMIRPGDVIAGGASGMGPCPPPQHQPPGGA